METMSLNATVRTEFGKGAARKIRKAGDLPAVVYRGGGEALSVIIRNDDLEAIFRRTMNRNTLIKLETGDSNRVCLVRDVQRHPVSQAIRHVDFYEVAEKEDLEVKVRVTTRGTAKGINLGGRLRIIRRELHVICRPADIPTQVEVDVTELEVDDILRISEVEAPKGCRFVFTEDFNLISVVGKRAAELDELDEETEGEGGGEDDGEAESEEG
jgi:large subunit ribosomal protein L25